MIFDTDRGLIEAASWEEIEAMDCEVYGEVVSIIPTDMNGNPMWDARIDYDKPMN